MEYITYIPFVVLDSIEYCFYCGKAVDMNAEIREAEHDHFISKFNGGKDHRDNLVVACIPCNRKKGKMNGDEFIEKFFPNWPL